MSQADSQIGSGKSGTEYRTEDNNGKKAILNGHKGGTAPTYKETGITWIDDSATPWKIKLYDGADWIVLGEVNATTNIFQPYIGAAATAESMLESTIASATTTDLGTLVSNFALVTGIATITGLGSTASLNRPLFFVRFSGALILTYNATSLILPTAANITTIAGDSAIFEYLGSGNWKCLSYNRLSGAPVTLGLEGTIASATTTDLGSIGVNVLSITGTTTITGLGSTAVTANPIYFCRFTGILTLTHNATSLILPGGASITTAAGDSGIFKYEGSGNWRCMDYEKASGLPNSLINIAQINVSQTFTGAQFGSISTLTDGSTITPDLSLNNNYIVTLGGNRTLAVPTGLVAGKAESFSIDVIQDNTGSRTLAYQWGYHFPNGTTPVLSTPGCSKDTLYGDVKVYATSTITVTIASPGVVTWTAHGLIRGQRIQLTTTGALPTGLSVNTSYYVVNVDANSFSLATSLVNAAAGTKINTSGSQSGTHTMVALRIDANLVKAWA